MSQTAVYDPLANLAPGDEIGVSHWVEITQDMINQFGASTLDPDPMHIDPEWSRIHSPFKDTIAFGFLTTSLLTHLLYGATKTQNIREHTKFGYPLNYGFDRMRLVSPVRVGAKVRGRFWLNDRRQVKGGRTVNCLHCVMEIEGEEKPALIADWLSMWVPAEAQ
ncbi:MAG: Nodulation protein N [Hyphomonadaceae bacterium]|nr:Nodulation protein N [Hyphomonadaceae bacterium]